MKNICILCGGKLRDGICTECGMDNRKSDDRYKEVLNQSSCDKVPMTHVHTREEGTKNKGKTAVKQKSYSHNGTNPKNFLGVIIAGAIILVLVVMSLVSYARGILEDGSRQGYSTNYDSSYEGILDEFSTQGEQ